MFESPIAYHYIRTLYDQQKLTNHWNLSGAKKHVWLRSTILNISSSKLTIEIAIPTDLVFSVDTNRGNLYKIGHWKSHAHGEGLKLNGLTHKLPYVAH